MLSAVGGWTNVLKIGILGVDSLWNHPDGDGDQQSLHLVFRADVGGLFEFHGAGELYRVCSVFLLAD